MTTALAVSSSPVEEAVRRACGRIAPTWPLDRFIAVNPFWELADRPFPAVAAELRAWSGARLFMPRAWYRQQRRDGAFTDAHLEAARRRMDSALTLTQLHARLESDEPELPRRARVMDVLDQERDLARALSWRDVVVTSTSQFCASYFDDGQASVGPDRSGGLFATWRRFALVDRGPEALLGVDGLRAWLVKLPASEGAVTAMALRELDVSEAQLEAYLASLLLDVNGWASWCAYRRWTARQQGGDDATLESLLAVRLAWEWVLLRHGGDATARRWQLAMAAWPRIDEACREGLAPEAVFQEALELARQERFVAQLKRAPSPRPEPVDAQVVCCIDVRSEPFRRALEAEAPRVQTLGFAGFFGLPIEFEGRPQLPGLLAPKLRVGDALATPGAREGARRATRGMADFRTGAASTFGFVEALGLGFGAALALDSLGRRSAPGALPGRPRLSGTVSGEPLAPAAELDLAANILRGMSLTRDFARLVVLLGHGSQTRNNPHAAGLDCGACCGQTGEVNARAAAALLNTPSVRTGLAARGLVVPESTCFVAGLHDTTTDEVRLFETDTVPASHFCDLAALQRLLALAGERLRATKHARPALAQVQRQQAGDWAQVRPEWGLARNAAFVIAPRERTRGLDLEGRSFLHEYRAGEDPTGAVLELLMTAPMVVTHWINLQYYASTVDNARYGSGNKVLHNVVGGHLGVFEGNGGDLRIGLPLQSLHDGARWVHEPVRLSVFIEAPREAIERVLEKHNRVRALVEGGWLALFQLDAAGSEVTAWRRGAWSRA